jgi:hypothetical protein
VLVFGDSHAPLVREQLINELNLLVGMQAGAGDVPATEQFAEYVRSPELLAHCRVVVWIISEHQLAKLQPLAEPIMKTLASDSRP